MKKPFFFALILLALILPNAWGEARFAAASWKNVQTFDIDALKQKEKALIGKVVGIRFNFRHKKIRHVYTNQYQGSLWQRRPEGKGKSSFMQVMFSKTDLEAFKALPEDSQNPSDLVVYGEVVRHMEADKWIFVRLLGSKATLDDAGNAVVGW